VFHRVGDGLAAGDLHGDGIVLADPRLTQPAAQAASQHGHLLRPCRHPHEQCGNRCQGTRQGQQREIVGRGTGGEVVEHTAHQAGRVVHAGDGFGAGGEQALAAVLGGDAWPFDDAVGVQQHRLTRRERKLTRRGAGTG
jgi:hypothetical protein